MTDVPVGSSSPSLSDSEMADVIRLAGVAESDIVAAADAGLLAMLAVETHVLSDLKYDIDEVASRSGLEVDRIRTLWGALGLAAPMHGERVFNDVDVEQLRRVAELVDSGLADPDIVMQLTRVIGSSMARIATAQVELLATRDDASELAVTDGADWFGDQFASVLGQVWRRHMHAAARGRLTGRLGSDAGFDAPPQAVGFADLVGFTALSQQLDSAALAAVVDSFEAVAFATVGSHGGRVVKMIGDEVMFAIADPVAAAQCALDLAESYHAADDLSDVRVGLAFGAVVDRDGDLFGPPVNLASRITAIAYPGTVVIDDEVRDRLPDDAFSFRTMLPRRLKHIGLVRLHVLRAVGEESAHRRERRDRRRARVAELVADVVLGSDDDDDGGSDVEQ